MNAAIKELTELLERIEKDENMRGCVRFDKVCVNAFSEGGLSYLFQTTQHYSPLRYAELAAALAKKRKSGGLVKLDQRCYVKNLAENPKLAEQFIKDAILMYAPAALPFVAPAAVDCSESGIDFFFNSQEDLAFFKSMNVIPRIDDHFRNEYQLSIRYSVRPALKPECEYKPSENVLNSKKNECEAKRKKRATSAAVKKHEVCSAKPSKSRTYKTREFTEYKIADLVNVETEKEFDCQIEGEVLAVESKETKTGDYLKHSIYVTDYTSSIECVRIEKKQTKNRFCLPAPGNWVYVIGKCAVDSYAKERVVKIKKIEPGVYESRTDNASEKRVELHAHTKMSERDGMTETDELIRQAAKWGHRAIAITDHGVVQAFPKADAAAKKANIKLIYGMEAYMVDDEAEVCECGQNRSFDDEFVVFTLTPTAQKIGDSELTEISAVKVRGMSHAERFHTLVRVSSALPIDFANAHTHLDQNALKNAPDIKEALAAFADFCGENPVLASFRFDFDIPYLRRRCAENEVSFSFGAIDLPRLIGLANPTLKNLKWKTVAKELKLGTLESDAASFAEKTAVAAVGSLRKLKERGVCDFDTLNHLAAAGDIGKTARRYHTILLCKNKTGLKNLYRLVTLSHLDHFYRKPRLAKSEIDKHREGLIVGSACEAGLLYDALKKGASRKKLESIASFYDYLEIQPVGNNEFMVRSGEVRNADEIREWNRQIVEIGDKLGKPVAATGDVHFLHPHDAYFREIMQQALGYDSTEQAPLYFHTTDEMLEEFSYLGEEKAHEVVIDVPDHIAAQVEEIELFQSDTAMPVIEEADKKITELAYRTAKSIYGDPLPDIVRERLERELDSVVRNQFSTLYYSAHLLVKKSNEDGYLVGSRGSVGSSFAATMLGITEVNPLAPHYVCPNCKHSDFNIDKEKYPTGADLPDAVCEKCGHPYKKDGYDIPFEVFLGINADKVPDIDLNFSGVYQPEAHKYVEKLFGAGHVFRAGTISGIKEQTAAKYARDYAEKTGTKINQAEMLRIMKGICGVKNTTGQHPGGMVIVPADREAEDFTPLQKPANKSEAMWTTTHFDYRSMHDILIKLDILGHDVPTIIRMLQDAGIDPLSIPFDDKNTLALFSSIEPLGIDPDDLFGIRIGTLGVPEFGTKFVREMLSDTKPATVSEIIRICGLSHGNDVWLGNAKDLIASGERELKEVICTRDDIMNYLVDRGVEKRTAFFIMEAVRKGKVAKSGFTEQMEQALKEAKIEPWFINSCRKIQYMFPKAHAVAYVIMSFRIAYCKLYHPKAFYSSYFTAKTDIFDASYVTGDLRSIKDRYKRLMLTQDISKTQLDLLAVLEVVCEMYLRGLRFLPVDIQLSDVQNFTIEEDGLRLPLLSIPQLGINVAQQIAEERSKYGFLSVEDLKNRVKVSTAVIEEMQNLGALVHLRNTNQISLFEC